MTREETIHELGEWLEQMIQHGVPSHSAKRKALATAIALLSAEPSKVDYRTDESANIGTEVNGLISRADAIEAVMAEGRKVYTSEYANAERIIYEADAVETLSMLPSADAGPTVIRSKTLMPTKDFKEWAKRIREVNPNAIVIPCDAEVVSADAVHKPDYSYEADMVKRLRQAEAIQGEWIDVENEPYCECSVCGSYIDNLDDDYAFCPRCGAKMDGERKEP